MLTQDSYARHETGDWKVSSLGENAKVWRTTEEGSVEEQVLPLASLTALSIEESSWSDPADL